MNELDELDWWVLRDDGTPVNVSFEEHCVWNRRPFEETRRIAETLIEGSTDVRISTVFLTIDHSWSGGPPILFETMVFGGPEEIDRWQERYSTLEDARAGHERAVAMVRKAMRAA